MFFSVSLDFDVDTGGKIKLHQCVDRLLRRLQNIKKTLVRANLKLLARLFVDVRRTQRAILFFTVGSGIGPAICAPVRRAVSTISPVD